MVNIKFSTSGSSFDDYGPDYQLEKIFEQIREKINSGKTEGKIIDINGNSIGNFTID